MFAPPEELAGLVYHLLAEAVRRLAGAVVMSPLRTAPGARLAELVDRCVLALEYRQPQSTL